LVGSIQKCKGRMRSWMDVQTSPTGGTTVVTPAGNHENTQSSSFDLACRFLLIHKPMKYEMSYIYI
jgi:hypothetical protein